MMQASLPDLEDDPRVTRENLHYASTASLKMETPAILRSYIEQRLPARMGSLYRNYFYSLRPNRSRNFEGQALMVVLTDYGNKLHCDPDYPRVKDLFLRCIDVNGFMDERAERRFKNLLMICFLPKSGDTSPPHDDCIMMIIEMTSELVNEIMLSSGNAEDADKLIYWLEDVLKPKTVDAFHVATWLFLRWLQNYKVLRDPARLCKLLQSCRVLDTRLDELSRLLDAAIPPSVETGQRVHYRGKKHLRTVLCNEEAPTTVYPSGSRNQTKFPHRRKVKTVVDGILQSYVKSRLPHPRYIRLFNWTPGTYTDFSQSPLGMAMTEYGEAISEAVLYQKIRAAASIRVFHLGPRLFIAKYILPEHQAILYDRIMTVCRLASDLINEFVVKGLDAKALKLFDHIIKSFNQSEKMGSIIQKGLFKLAHFLPEIKKKSRWNLLYDHSLLGGPSPTTGNVPAPEQDLPLISAEDTPMAEPKCKIERKTDTERLTGTSADALCISTTNSKRTATVVESTAGALTKLNTAAYSVPPSTTVPPIKKVKVSDEQQLRAEQDRKSTQYESKLLLDEMDETFDDVELENIQDTQVGNVEFGQPFMPDFFYEQTFEEEHDQMGIRELQDRQQILGDQGGVVELDISDFFVQQQTVEEHDQAETREAEEQAQAVRWAAEEQDRVERRAAREMSQVERRATDEQAPLDAEEDAEFLRYMDDSD